MLASYCSESQIDAESQSRHCPLLTLGAAPLLCDNFVDTH